MKDGFIKVATVSPELRVADVAYNVEKIKEYVLRASLERAKIVVCPELALTGYTCADLFYHKDLVDRALLGLKEIAGYTLEIATDAVVFVGLPLMHEGSLYDVAGVVNQGAIVGFVPKSNLLSYGEYCETRHFCPAFSGDRYVSVDGVEVPFSTSLVFEAEGLDLKIGVEIGADMLSLRTPSTTLAEMGANVIVNLSADSETVTKREFRLATINALSSRLSCAYLYANAGKGESTTDLVFAGHRVISENGSLIAESPLFADGMTVAEIDVNLLSNERKKTGFKTQTSSVKRVKITLKEEDTIITRTYPKTPFVPTEKGVMKDRAEVILTMQAEALKKRLVHTHTGLAVIGISGGLDSALALLVSARTKALMGGALDILGITMPCFGTTGRTLDNAKVLTKALGATCTKISIKTAVNRHLADIKQPKDKFDVAFENAQARERTQILMDVANSRGGLVVGTGDLSEVALGWSTYNGDHMSMYGVNASIPKTLVKYLVAYEAYRLGGKAKTTLLDILDTPISPELLPTDGATMTQKTEDKIGPYELHDFFLYYFIRHNFTPTKILRIATQTFDGIYTKETIKKWLTVFVKRFFTQQFKRSCMPDGVKVGSVALSPRGDLKMPSDAVVSLWLDTLK